MPNVDIHDAILTAMALAALGALWLVWLGARALKRAGQIRFFRIRRQRLAAGWRMIVGGIFLGLLAFGLGRYGEPVVYSYFPPSPTPSLTPTITLTPTISLTPTITLTPTLTLTPVESYTPTITPTPFLPPQVAARFSSTVTPNPSAVFSPLTFATRVVNAQPVNPATVFRNPVGHMYAVFSYDNMIPGSQWTALWYRDGQLVYFETKPWDGEAGGYGFSDWNPDPGEWLPGRYQVQIFVGEDWEVVGEFTVEGEPYTPTQTRTPTLSPTPTLTPRPTDTLWPTPTRTP